MDKRYDAVTYKWIKVTDDERTEVMLNCLSGDGSRLRCSEDCRWSHKERIRTKQVTDKERSTNVLVQCNRCIKDKTNINRIRNARNVD